MPDPTDVVRLKELIVALDNRQVQPARTAEAGIARDAAEMRNKAVARLAELEAEPPESDS